MSSHPAQAKSGDDESLDLIHGAKAIGAFIGVTERRAFRLLENGELPATKFGQHWAASKSALRARAEGK